MSPASLSHTEDNYCVFFEFFDCTQRNFIVWAAKLNQHICFKGIMTSKFGSNDMLLLKTGSSFVSTEDENL